MQYDIDGGNITVVIGEEARMDVPTALNYIKSGQDEIEATVNAGIDAFDLNAANKTTDYNDNASAKVTAYNDNATAKTDAFDLNASNKTNDFNDNYTIKKGLIDASVDAAAGSASAASASADLAQQWAVKMDGKVADEDYSAKYYADLASQSAGATGANKDLSNLTAAGEARFTAKQDVISDLSTIRSGAALGDTSVQLSGAQTITGEKTFASNVTQSNGSPREILKNTDCVKGTAPANNETMAVQFKDSNDNLLGTVQTNYETTKKITSQLRVYKAHSSSDTDSISIGVGYTANGNRYSWAPTPTLDSSATDYSGQIATVGWIDGSNSNLVHRTGNETIAGSKTFTSDPYIKNAAARLYLDNTNQTKGTAPSADVWSSVTFSDTNGNYMGRCRQLYAADKSNKVELQVHKANSSSDTDSATMGIKYPASGSAYGFAPNSDVNGSIVTTVSKSKAKNGYFKLGNGLIVQWGSVTASSVALTITLPTAFSSATSYSISAITNNGKAAFTQQQTSTTFHLDASGGIGNTSLKWIAIGY